MLKYISPFQNRRDQRAQEKIKELADIRDKATFLERLKENYPSDVTAQENLGTYIAKHCSKSIVQEFLSMLEMQFRALNFTSQENVELLYLLHNLGKKLAYSQDTANTQLYLNLVSIVLSDETISAQDKFDFLMLRDNEGWTLGMYIARYQDAANTQQYLNLVSKVLSDKTISAQNKRDFLKHQDTLGWTLGMVIARYQDAATTQQYLNLVSDIWADESISALDKNELFKLQMKVGFTLAMLIDRNQNVETRAAYWRLALPYTTQGIESIHSKIASTLMAEYLEKIKSNNASAQDFICLGILVANERGSFKEVRPYLAQSAHMDDLNSSLSVAAECFNRALEINPDSDVFYLLARCLIVGKVSRELYSSRDIYSDVELSIEPSEIDRALYLLRKVPADSMFYTLAQEEAKSLRGNGVLTTTYNFIVGRMRRESPLSWAEAQSQFIKKDYVAAAQTAKALLASNPKHANARILLAVMINRNLADDDGALINAPGATRSEIVAGLLRTAINDSAGEEAASLATFYLATLIICGDIEAHPSDFETLQNPPLKAAPRTLAYELLQQIPASHTEAHDFASRFLAKEGRAQRMSACRSTAQRGVSTLYSPHKGLYPTVPSDRENVPVQNGDSEHKKCSPR